MKWAASKRKETPGAWVDRRPGDCISSNACTNESLTVDDVIHKNMLSAQGTGRKSHLSIEAHTLVHITSRYFVALRTRQYAAVDIIKIMTVSVCCESASVTGVRKLARVK